MPPHYLILTHFNRHFDHEAFWTWPILGHLESSDLLPRYSRRALESTGSLCLSEHVASYGTTLPRCHESWAHFVLPPNDWLQHEVSGSTGNEGRKKCAGLIQATLPLRVSTLGNVSKGREGLVLLSEMGF